MPAAIKNLSFVAVLLILNQVEPALRKALFIVVPLKEQRKGIVVSTQQLKSSLALARRGSTEGESTA